MTTAAVGYGGNESMTPRGDGGAAVGASGAEYAAMTPGDGSEPGTPPSTRRQSFGKNAGISVAYDLLAPIERSGASKSYASSSAHSNILSPRYNKQEAAAMGAHEEEDGETMGITDDRDEIGTPKTPEGEESVMMYHKNGGHHNDGSGSGIGGGFYLPQLSPPQPTNQRQLHNLAARSPGSTHSKSGAANNFRRSQTYVKQLSRESARELAKTALSLRATSIGEFTFDARESSVRENIRRVQAYSRRETPLEYTLTTCVRHKHRKCTLRLDEEAISWTRRNKIKGTIDTDDIVGAERIAGKKGGFRVHFFLKGRGTGASALQRQPCSLDFHCSKEAAHMADKWVDMIQELVRWQARAPPIADKRRIKVVVNPHSGKRQARRIWEQRVKKYFDLGNFEYEVEETTYSGHAIDMGKEYSPDDGFEALVFIGGDGTLGEFMNGLLTRPEHEWREIVAGTPISLISAGTQNAFGSGVGIPTAEASVYCIIKRKIRPLDVITATAAADPEKVHYSYCGLGWGVAGDIAAESERYRWMGTSRYAFLKVKRAALMPKKHTGRVRYVRTEPQPELCKYDDIRDAGAFDQFEMEEGNVYDFDRNSGMQRKSWGGYGGAVRSPASHQRYPEEMWTEETGRYMVVGVVNIAPDGKYAHPSDGNLDLILTRKGNIFRELQLGILYLMGKELKSPLVSYIKVKAVEIQPDEPTDAMNNDGEVLSGGPWRMEVIPSLFKALSEK